MSIFCLSLRRCFDCYVATLRVIPCSALCCIVRLLGMVKLNELGRILDLMSRLLPSQSNQFVNTKNVVYEFVLSSYFDVSLRREKVQCQFQNSNPSVNVCKTKPTNRATHQQTDGQILPSYYSILPQRKYT